MKLPIYQVDAFTDRVFAGNPAAVSVLPYWLPDTLLQAIAAENNLSETAFVVAAGAAYQLRWFTPVAEVDLCGHATLATAHVLFSHCGVTAEELCFQTRSGELRVRRQATQLCMDFPALVAQPCEPPAALLAALPGVQVVEVLRGADWLVQVQSAHSLRALQPDLGLLATLELRGVCVTAAADEPGVDFVSRFFAPKYGIAEDPVTGSAHCLLAPYWAAQLGRTSFTARQVSQRGGTLHVQMCGERVQLAGQAVTFLVGEMWLAD